MQTKLVVIIGVGMVGSQIAEELAKCGVGRLRFIDHEDLERANLSRHALDDRYLGRKKAGGLKDYLTEQVDGLRAEAIPRKIDQSVSGNLLDQWLADADLIIAATDDHQTQRRIGWRALVLGIPSIFPALYVEGGGEIVVQFDHQLPCFSCWDEFRPANAPLRGAQALNFIALPVIYTSLRLCLGILDPRSDERELMRAGRTQDPYLVFALNRSGTLHSGFNTWRSDCPACGGSPASSNRDIRQDSDDLLDADVIEGLIQWSAQHPPAPRRTPQPEYQQENDNPILPILGGVFQFIAGGLGLLVGGFLALWAAVIGILLVLAAVGGTFYLFIVLLGHLGGS